MGSVREYALHGRIDYSNGSVYVDVGLFTRRFDTWVSVRLAMLALVACTAYRLLLFAESAGRAAFAALKAVGGRESDGTQEVRSERDDATSL
jgi:hypothetical protein